MCEELSKLIQTLESNGMSIIIETISVFLEKMVNLASTFEHLENFKAEESRLIKT